VAAVSSIRHRPGVHRRRENEGRALMLGYNTFYFKLAALIVSSFFAALAGMMHALYQRSSAPDVVASLT